MIIMMRRTKSGVIEGELEVTIGKRADPGVVAIAPENTPHSVLALTDAKAIAVDYPLREDF